MPDASFSDASPGALPVTIVGAGAVGRALARRLAARGFRIAAVVSRNAADARALADRVADDAGSRPTAAASVDALPGATRLVMLCVPDDAVPEVAAALADVDHPWPDTLAAHTSGALTTEALAPLAHRGASTLSFHPVQTFTARTPPSAFDGIVVTVEGDAAAQSVGEAVAARLGAQPVRVSRVEKARYHSAAALASNGLVALMAAVRDVLATADIEGDTAAAFVRPLVTETWRNLQAQSPEEALTGPVARGDRGTVRAHLAALSATAPHLVGLYVELAGEMLRLAERDGRLSADAAAAMRDTLRAARPADSA